MKKPRKIAVVTGTRAEYGLLYALLRAIADDPDLELQLIATGMHLSPEFGETYKVIEEDGFGITRKVELLLSSDTPAGISKSVGLGCIGFADAFTQLQPDLVFLLGDRFEVLAAALACLPARIPIAHAHGGELTRGAIDDSLRHCITKLAHLHFTATEAYRRRVIQLGEQPEFVFNVGIAAQDNLRQMELLSREALEERLNFRLGAPTLLVTFHPETLAADPAAEFDELLMALEEWLLHHPEGKILLTKPNADTHSRPLLKRCNAFGAAHPERVGVFQSLGRLRYYSAMKHCAAVVGNSSSGILEAPFFQMGTVNIGNRQQGRIMPPSVVNCGAQHHLIRQALATVLSEEFRQRLPHMENPYGNGAFAQPVLEILKATDLNALIPKSFFDLPPEALKEQWV